MPVPVDITTRPDLQGTVPIETASRPSYAGSSGTSSNSRSSQPAPATNGQSSNPHAPQSNNQSNQPGDVAGVLRRNQACLACRRRKLKCDAIRPHCSTCVRSYRHLLRTAPSTNPVLSCEYDDAVDKDNGDHHEAAAAEDEDDGKKKKRKASGGRKKREEEQAADEERERLTRKIAELEEQLAKRSQMLVTVPPGMALPTAPGMPPPGASAAQAQPQTSRWTGFVQPQAESPTAFLDMLSSAASNASTAPAPTGPGLPTMNDMNGMSGVNDVNDLNGLNGMTGITPMWTSNDRSGIGMTTFYPFEADATMADASKTRSPPNGGAPQMLSPNGVFNFSPAPSGQTPQWNAQPSESQDKSSKDPWHIDNLQSVLTGASNMPNGVDSSMPLNGQPTALDEIKAAKAAEQAAEADFGSAQADGMLDSQILMDLFWPGWPVNLPPPPVVNSLVDAFFELVPNIPRLLHRGRFVARLALPPTHSNFPHASLLHAICSLASTWCSPTLYENDAFDFDKGRAEFYMRTGPIGPTAAKHPHPFTEPFNKGPIAPALMPFSLRQAAYGKDAVTQGLNTGNRLFDVVRAMIILSRVFIDDTRMLECWTYSGLVSRMVLPLGLNVRSAELSLKAVMLPPPVDALEREERRVVVWMAMYHDTIASAASGWGTSMALDELTVPLPVSREDFENGSTDMDQNPQDLESLDLYIKHPVPDPFVMTLKGTVLLHRVNKFSRKWKNRKLRENDDLDGMMRPEFRELANAIACLQMSFPPSLSDPTKMDDKKRLDVDLVSAHSIPQAAIICLYEPFADITDPNDQPARRILNASRMIIGVFKQLVGLVPGALSNLGVVIHSSSSVALVTAARTLLLFYRQALNVGDNETAETYRVDVETARMVLHQYGLKFKIGHHHAQLIEYFLDRATNPTYEKLAAHYPDHPRGVTLPLTQDSHMGQCVLNALNIKRGYWKIPAGGRAVPTAGVNIASVSPSSSTPGSVGSGGAAPHGPGSVSESPVSTASYLTGMPGAWGRASATVSSMDTTHDSTRNSSAGNGQKRGSDGPGSASEASGAASSPSFLFPFAKELGVTPQPPLNSSRDYGKGDVPMDQSGPGITTNTATAETPSRPHPSFAFEKYWQDDAAPASSNDKSPTGGQGGGARIEEIQDGSGKPMWTNRL